MIAFKLKDMHDKNFTYMALNGKDEIGYCKFSICEQYVQIKDVKAYNDDELIAQGLIRSALNFAANRNAYIAKADCNANLSTLLKPMGFYEKDGFLLNDIPSALKCNCSK